MGADENYLDNCPRDTPTPWKCPKNVIEIIVHKLYNKKVKKRQSSIPKKGSWYCSIKDWLSNQWLSNRLGFKLFIRRNSIESFLGANLLEKPILKPKFNKEELMPVCLPSSDKFKDTGKGKVHL